MSDPPSAGPIAPVEPFFESLFAADASGSSWLARLLSAAPYGHRLGELAAAPGWLATPLAVRGAGGRLACFDFPATPSRQLLRWFIDHPDRLTWADTGAVSPHAVRLRRALVCDDPPGSQARAQERARELLASRMGLAPEWWRFEESGRLDCVLITGRLVVTVTAPTERTLAPSTPWYPRRTRLVRDLEAARQIAAGRAWATLVLSGEPVAGAGDDELAASLEQGAPHLDAGGRDELRGAYVGNLTWEDALAAVGLPPAALSAPVASGPMA